MDYWEIKETNIEKYLPFLNGFLVIYFFFSDYFLRRNTELDSLQLLVYLTCLLVILISPLLWKKNYCVSFCIYRIILLLALMYITYFTGSQVVLVLYIVQLVSIAYWYKSRLQFFVLTCVLTFSSLAALYMNPMLRGVFFQWGLLIIIINFGVAHILYEQIENKVKLRQISKVFKIMLNTTNNGIQFIDAQGQTRILNPAAQIIYSSSEDEILGKFDWEVYYNRQKYDENGKYTSLITESLETGKTHKDIERSFVDELGKTKTYLIETFQVSDEHENEIIGAIGIYRDISEQKEMERQLLDAHYEMANMAVTDELTKLYNVRYFRQRLTTEIAKAFKSTLSLLIIDVDYFKIYNDLFGHPQGDVVLTEIGKMLKESFRESDIVSRYGGEEFTVILPGMDKEKAKDVAERIRLKIKEHEFYGEEQLPGGDLTVTIGIAAVPDDAQTAEELIKIADDALYKGKYTTRDVVVTLNSLNKKFEMN